VKINDKHIEVIIRQMLRKTEVQEAGRDGAAARRAASTARARSTSTIVRKHGGKKAARLQPVLLGITKASLATESFISAASFQETTRVLTEAAVRGLKDDLRGPQGECHRRPAHPGGAPASQPMPRAAARWRAPTVAASWDVGGGLPDAEEASVGEESESAAS